MSTTPYMGLLLPDPSVTVGPTYATENNAAFTALDAHDHSSGKGVAVPVAGLNINADLPLNAFNLTLARSLRMVAQGGALGLSTDKGCLFVSGVDLWYNDINGVQIQLTAGGALNAASIGAIGGDYATSTASEFYTNASKTFSFTQAANTPAKIDCGPILLRKATASSNSITLTPAAGIASDYTLTLPAALPASTSVVTSDSAGNLAFVTSLTLVNATITGLLTVSGKTTGDILPNTTAVDSLGSIANSYKRLILNGTTDGGYVAFAGTTSSTLLSSTGGLVLRLQGFTVFRPETDNGASLGSSSVGWQSLRLSTNISSGTPNVNNLYADLIPKAWGTTNGTGTLEAFVNLTLSSGGTGTYNFSFKTAMSNGTYAVLVTPLLTSGIGVVYEVTNRTTTGFTVITYRSTTEGLTNGGRISVLVFGVQ